MSQASAHPFGGLALGLTGPLFVAGLGYLHALGALHHENRSVPP